MTPMPDINEPTEAALELGEKLKVPNVEFDAWVASMPAKHWSKYDLSACRLGWEAALDAERQKREAAERERDDYRRMFDECAVARDASGFLGTVPQCIEHWSRSYEAAEASLAKAIQERDEAREYGKQAPSFADGIDAEGLKREFWHDVGTPSADGRYSNLQIETALKYLVEEVVALAHNPQASSGGEVIPEREALDNAAVDRFAAEMKRKLKWEREFRGRHGWDNPTVCTTDYLSRLLWDHMKKGDPVDVGNLAMMLHQRAAKIGPNSSEPLRHYHTDPQRSGAAEGNGAEAAAPKPDPAIAELVEQIIAGNAPMSKWVGSIDYSTYEGFEKYLEVQLREALHLKASLDKKRDNDAVSESLATFVDGKSGAIEEALATFRTVRARETAALTASNDRVAELERERDEALATMTRATEAMVECGNLLADEELKREAAEAEVPRLKAGAVTDWQLIESVPKDGRSIAVWLPATATEQPHAFAPVSICEDGTWWGDSTGDQIEPLAATYWAPIHAPSALSNQAGASK